MRIDTCRPVMEFSWSLYCFDNCLLPQYSFSLVSRWMCWNVTLPYQHNLSLPPCGLFLCTISGCCINNQIGLQLKAYPLFAIANPILTESAITGYWFTRGVCVGLVYLQQACAACNHRGVYVVCLKHNIIGCLVLGAACCISSIGREAGSSTCAPVMQKQVSSTLAQIYI